MTQSILRPTAQGSRAVTPPPKFRLIAASALLASTVAVPRYLLAQDAQPAVSAATVTSSADTPAAATQTTDTPAAGSPAAAPGSPAAPILGSTKLADFLATTGITATGYVSASYYYSSDDSTYHEFDTAHDTLQIDQAAITVAYQPKEGFGALVNLMAGEDARFTNEQENGHDGLFNITQAYLQYASGPLTLIGGRFLSLAGAESENPTLDTNFSRGLVYYSEPITHTGFRATYAVTDAISVIAGVNEGWNTSSNAYGSKTGELALLYTPNKTFSITGEAYVGKDPDYDATRALLDVIATYNATSSLTFILNYCWGQQQLRPELGTALPSRDWDGLAGFVNYAFNSRWRISLRGEFLDDQGGFVTGTPEKIEEGTVTAGYSPVKSFELRLEARYDTSNEATFEYETPDTDTFDAHQTGFAVQGIYKF